MNVSLLLRRRSFNFLTSKRFSSDEKIIIPKRIPRGPTDILRTLESTVGTDPTASHYKFHDDPFLIPSSNIGKRTFAMAKEAGRKAAQWVRKENAELFQHKECDPPIEAFFPPVIYNENSEVSEEVLNKLIDTVQLSDAKLVYNLLNSKGIEVSEDTKQKLLELFCYQNSTDALPEDLIEERWFRQSNKLKEKNRKTWKDGDFAEELFISLKDPSTEAYAALIQGMTKYHQVDKAMQIFEEAKQKDIVLNTNTYNNIIKISNFVKESYEMRWELVINRLVEMKDAKLKPNLATLNSVLFILSTMGVSNNTRQLTLKTLAEFKKLDIEPSLGSWYYVLTIFCKERGPVSTILNDIMNEIENKNHLIQDITDTNFFVTAMDVCLNRLNDIELAKRVDKLLHYGDNYNLIGDSYKESIYFRLYFLLFCQNLPFDDFMNDVYFKLVPHIYVPEPGVMSEVLNQIEVTGAIQYLPKLWSDIVIFDQCYRENIIESVLNIISSNESDNTDLLEKFSIIAWQLFEKIDGQNVDRTERVVMTGEYLGKIMIALTRNKDLQKASRIMTKLDKEHQSISGLPKLEALSLFVDLCIEEKLPSKAIDCIQYAADCGFPETSILAAKLNEKLTLDEESLNRLSRIVDGAPLIQPKIE